MTYTFITLASPVGELKLVANGSRLAAILWENDKPNRVRLGPMSEAPDNPDPATHRATAGANILPDTRNPSIWSWILPGRSFRRRSGWRC